MAGSSQLLRRLVFFPFQMVHVKRQPAPSLFYHSVLCTSSLLSQLTFTCPRFPPSHLVNQRSKSVFCLLTKMKQIRPAESEQTVAHCLSHPDADPYPANSSSTAYIRPVLRLVEFSITYVPNIQQRLIQLHTISLPALKISTLSLILRAFASCHQISTLLARSLASQAVLRNAQAPLL